MSITLIFASQNRYKIQEISDILTLQNLQNKIFIQGLDAIDLSLEIPETSNTIEGNALQKATYIHEHFQVNCFAEDTGLEIDYLNGEPGVYSARYAGGARNDQDNINLVLKKMANTGNRSARFKTIIALIFEGQEYLFEGLCEGSIAYTSKGTGGFGYDPIFIPAGYPCSFAEMSNTKKNQISHRYKALNKMLDFFKQQSI